MKCEICGKTPIFGENVSHSKRHTNRVYKPNVHSITVTVDGKSKKMNLCTRCLRTRNKASK